MLGLNSTTSVFSFINMFCLLYFLINGTWFNIHEFKWSIQIFWSNITLFHYLLHMNFCYIGTLKLNTVHWSVSRHQCVCVPPLPYPEGTLCSFFAKSCNGPLSVGPDRGSSSHLDSCTCGIKEEGCFTSHT